MRRVSRGTSPGKRAVPEVVLPPVELHGGRTVEATLESRRSVRDFGPERLSLNTLGQLLWAAQGVTAGDGRRTAPSAGALYPLELFVAAWRVDGLPSGIYRYVPTEHAVRLHLSGDRHRGLSDAALEQSAVRDAAAVLVIAAVYARTSAQYGRRAERYVHMEAGHAAQNVYLQATALELGTVIIGAFEDACVTEALELPANIVPLALLPVGVRR